MQRGPNKIIFLALFLAVLISSGIAQEKIKVGVVNSLDVLEKSIEGKGVLARLEERNKSNQDKLANLDEDIRQLQTKLNTQRLTLTQDALMSMSSDLDKKQTERKRFAEDSYRDYNDLQNRLFNKIKSEMVPIIEQIGKEMSLEVIFDLTNSGIIWFGPTVDLTAEVIKRYDASKSLKK